MGGYDWHAFAGGNGGSGIVIIRYLTAIGSSGTKLAVNQTETCKIMDLQDNGISVFSVLDGGTVDACSTSGALIIPRLTTTQRDGLTPVNGMIIYNTITEAFNFYENFDYNSDL